MLAGENYNRGLSLFSQLSYPMADNITSISFNNFEGARFGIIQLSWKNFRRATNARKYKKKHFFQFIINMKFL
jgi:hypothetical protein